MFTRFVAAVAVMFSVGILVSLPSAPAKAGDDSGWLEQGELLSPEDEQTLLEIAGGNETHAGVDEVIERHRYESTLQSEELTGLLESTLRTGDGDESAGLLREILSRPEFQDGSAPTQQNNGAIDRFVQWLNRTLSGLGRSLGLGAAGGSLLTYVLVVLALALMAMLIRQLIMGAGRPAATTARSSPWRNTRRPARSPTARTRCWRSRCS